MNLDQQLRAVLGQEAEMQEAPALDVDRLISGGRGRQRRRNLARVGVAAAAAAVLVAAGVYGVTRIDSGTAVEPARVPHTTTPQAYRATRNVIDPGRYRMLVGHTTGTAIHADFTIAGAGWQSDDYPVLSEAGSFGAVAVYRPLALAAGTGCVSDKPNRKVATTRQRLAQQLAQLPRSTVIRAPTPVPAFGRPAVHLRLLINQHCGAGVYRVADTPRGGHGITYTGTYAGTPKDVVIDFWVVEVAGVPVVVDMWHDADASSQLVGRIARTRDSIIFDTGG